VILLALSLLASAPVCSAGPPEKEAKPIVYSIAGDGVIVIVKPEGKNVTVERGAELNVGDHLRTGPHTSAVIRYADGSKLFLGRGTDVVLGRNTGETQWNDVSYGQVRGIVPKIKGLAGGGPPRFAVRSRAAVMGVRGTDFVFQANDAAVNSEVRTLEGLVEVAKDEEALMSGKGVAVKEGQFVSANADKVADVKKFNRDKYLKEFEYQQPEMMAMVRSDPDARPQSLQGAAAGQEREPPPDYGPIFRPLVFRAGGYGVLEVADRPSFQISGHVSWNPSLRLLWSLLHLRAHVGVAFLRSATDGNFFVSTQAALLPSIQLFDVWFIEAGAGVETWWDYGRPGLMLMANTGFILGRDSFFERLYFGASVYDQTTTTGIKRTFLSAYAGIGFQIPTGSKRNTENQK
jgi:hypothetical protein